MSGTSNRMLGPEDKDAKVLWNVWNCLCLCGSTASRTRSLESLWQFITTQHTTQKCTVGRT